MSNKCEAGYALPKDGEHCGKCGSDSNGPCWEAFRTLRLKAESADVLADALAVIVRYLEQEDEEGLIGHTEPMMKAHAALAAYRGTLQHAPCSTCWLETGSPVCQCGKSGRGSEQA